MLARVINIFAILTLITACENQSDMKTEQNRLLDTDRQFAAMSLAEGAGEAFNYYLAEDAMGLSNGQHPVLGRANLYAEMKEGQENYTLAWEPQRAEVAASRDMGWTWGTYTFSFMDDAGVEQKRYGKYLNIWQRQPDGEWRVVVDMGNSSPPPVADSE